MEISKQSDGDLNYSGYDVLVENMTLATASLPEPTVTNEQEFVNTKFRCKVEQLEPVQEQLLAKGEKLDYHSEQQQQQQTFDLNEKLLLEAVDEARPIPSLSTQDDVIKLRQDLDDCKANLVRQNTDAMKKDAEIQIMRAQLESSQLVLKVLTSQMENITRSFASLSLRLDQLSSTSQTNKDDNNTELKTIIASSISNCENSISNLHGTVIGNKNTNDDKIRALRLELDSLTNAVAANKSCLSKVSTTAPLHRYWNLSRGDHLYTTNWNELGSGKLGYVYEGVAGYVHTNPTN